MAGKEKTFKNILVMHFGQLGDVVLGLSALAALRKQFAEAKITVMSGQSTAEIIKIAAVADEQIAVDRVGIRDGNKFRSIATIFALVLDVRRRRFDLVVDLHSLSETNLLGFVSGSNSRLYANRENRSLDRLGNFPVRPPKEDKTKHLTERYLDVIAPLGINDAERTFRLKAETCDLAFVRDRYLKGGDTVCVGLFPGAGHPSRCWPLSNFAELAVEIVKNKRKPVVFLGPEELGLRGDIKTKFPPETLIISGLTLAQFIAAVSLVDAFVTNDTGPLHLAAAAGVPIVLLLDNRAPTTYLPLAENIIVVSGGTIDEISVADACEAIRNALKRH